MKHLPSFTRNGCDSYGDMVSLPSGNMRQRDINVTYFSCGDDSTVSILLEQDIDARSHWVTLMTDDECSQFDTVADCKAHLLKHYTIEEIVGAAQ